MWKDYQKENDMVIIKKKKKKLIKDRNGLRWKSTAEPACGGGRRKLIT